MTSRKRLSICYAAPGQNLLPSAGPTRNVLNVADALSEWADVTVAFRRIREPIPRSRYKIVAIEPHRKPSLEPKDDNATRGLYPLQHLSYCQTLRSFSRQQARLYDVVLEKGWRLSGYLLNRFRCHGVPGALIENDVRFWSEPMTSITSIAKYALHASAHWVAGRCSRHASLVIAETEELKRMLIRQRRLSPERVHVISLGVDHALFRPGDQQSERASLQISQDALVVLYVGAMDEYHDLEPLIEALGTSALPSVELHVVGDGEYRIRCEELAARTQTRVRFHGPVPHGIVPKYIVAADLCVAPYRTSAFPDGLLPFSTLKIPEYMACGRPVVSVPRGSVEKLIENDVSGFLFRNDVRSWQKFFKTMPSREELAQMGRAAANAVKSLGWDKTAEQYLELCESLIASRSAQ